MSKQSIQVKYKMILQMHLEAQGKFMTTLRHNY